MVCGQMVKHFGTKTALIRKLHRQTRRRLFKSTTQQCEVFLCLSFIGNRFNISFERTFEMG